jgi:aminoglycoside phosphotransferase (APT) family kinase protein
MCCNGDMRMHADELEIDDEVVHQLVSRDLPTYAHLELRRLGVSGSSNVLFRLGSELLVRLPRQPGGSVTIDKEARYLPLIAATLPVKVPEIVTVGNPGYGYPERWSVTRWIEGQPLGTPIAIPPETGLSPALAAVLVALRDAEIPAEAHADPALRSYRAGPIRAIDDAIRRGLTDCREIADLPLDIPACKRFWDSAMEISDPASDDPRHWVHGDLLAENLLTRRGHLSAVLDLGGLALGHAGVDLIPAWEILGPADRATFRSTLGTSEVDWARGRAWAFAIAVMTFPYYWHTMPARCADRLVMVNAVLEDFKRNS